MAAIKDFRRSQLVLRRKCPAGRKAASFCRKLESVAARIIQRVHPEAAANPSDERMKGFLEELLGAGGSPLPALTANCFSAQFRRACRLIPHSSSSAPTAVIRHLQRKLQRWASPLLFMLTPMTEFPQR
jgi:hypothetical protein